MPRTARAYSRRRKGYRRAKSMRKRAFKRTRYSKRSAPASFRRYAKRIINVGGDVKRKDDFNVYNDPANTLDVTMCLTDNLDQGTSASERLADKFTGHGMININIAVRYALRTSDEANTGAGPVTYRQCRFHFFIFRDMRPANISTTGTYSVAQAFDIDSVFNKQDLGFFFKYPRNLDIKYITRRTVVFDMDDEKNKSEERRLSIKIPITGKQIEYYGSSSAQRHKGHYWLIWYMDRVNINTEAIPVPVRGQVRVDWEYGFTG